MALDIIAEQPRLAGCPFVFAAGHGDGPFNAFSLRKGEIDEKLPKGMPAWRIHDLRRTARSLMSRAGVSSDHAERVLGHAIVGVEGVYDRHHYKPEMAHALKQLASLVEQIVNPSKSGVIRLDQRRRKARR
jgi:integrase